MKRKFNIKNIFEFVVIAFLVKLKNIFEIKT